ncbi:hypothetical protein [Nocardia aurea]|uniref:Uncharacterized protein n=1 Tax=Nocardia aurea TaxID=2144174 RepID=A0ABV3FRD8_9NOCA
MLDRRRATAGTTGLRPYGYYDDREFVSEVSWKGALEAFVEGNTITWSSAATKSASST